MDNSRFVLSTESAVLRPRSYRSVPSSEIELTGYAEDDRTLLVNSHIQGQASWIHDRVKAIRPTITREGLRNTSSNQRLIRFLLNLLPISVILGLVVFIGLMSFSDSSFVYMSGVCRPDGTFMLTFSDSYTPWSQDTVFAINMSYGSYTFGIAKLIDIVWDVVSLWHILIHTLHEINARLQVVGRGGQALMAIITYKVFTGALNRLMESSSVSTSTFEAISFQHDTLIGVSKLIRHLQQISSVPARGTMFCIILSSLFTLVLPTWLSAMTGYTADITAFVQDANENLIPAQDFLPWIYTIHDGKRLGDPYTDDYRVVVPWSDTTDMSLETGDYGCDFWNGYPHTNGSITWTETANENCTLIWLISQYTSVYGLLGQNDTESLFMLPNHTNVTIPKPSLNISANLARYDVDCKYDSCDDAWAKHIWYFSLYGSTWVSNITHDAPFHNSNPMFYYGSSGTAYNVTQMNERGSCQQPHQVRYKWGFSFLLLYAFLVTWLVWTVVMYGLFLDSYYNSRLNAADRKMGLKRAILDLSTSMQKHFKAEDVVLYSNAQLCSIVKEHEISYQNMIADPLPPARMEGAVVLPWTRREKWWLAALCVFSLFLGLSWVNERFSTGWSQYFSAMPVVGILIVLTLARKRRRRWLHFAFWFLFFWVGNIWWMTVSLRRGEYYGY